MRLTVALRAAEGLPAAPQKPARCLSWGLLPAAQSPSPSICHGHMTITTETLFSEVWEQACRGRNSPWPPRAVEGHPHLSFYTGRLLSGLPAALPRPCSKGEPVSAKLAAILGWEGGDKMPSVVWGGPALSPPGTGRRPFALWEGQRVASPSLPCPVSPRSGWQEGALPRGQHTLTPFPAGRAAEIWLELAQRIVTI